METAKDFWADAEIISTYTRAQAIEDGFMVDVSDTAREAGITVPVTLTNEVYEDCVHWTDEDSKRQTYQDESGRLWDVVSMLAFRMRISKARNEKTDTLYYKMIRVPRGGRGRRPREVILKAVIGGGDNGEPVITVMQKDQD